MKNLFQFLKEATASQASMQAKKLNLKSDGHGGWVDSRGEFVAKTENGKLKFYNKGQRPGRDPDQIRAEKQLITKNQRRKKNQKQNQKNLRKLLLQKEKRR